MGALGTLAAYCRRPRVAAGVARSTVVFARPNPLITYCHVLVIFVTTFVSSDRQLQWWVGREGG